MEEVASKNKKVSMKMDLSKEMKDQVKIWREYGWIIVYECLGKESKGAPNMYRQSLFH